MRILVATFILLLLIGCDTYSSPTSVRRTAEQIESEEFNALIKQDSINKQITAAESLEVLLGDDPDENRVSLIINNSSNCNVIVRFAGEKSYNLPIPKNSRNFIVIPKGTYAMGANLCRSRFSSTKTFYDSATMTLTEGQ